MNNDQDSRPGSAVSEPTDAWLATERARFIAWTETRKGWGPLSPWDAWQSRAKLSTIEAALATQAPASVPRDTISQAIYSIERQVQHCRAETERLSALGDYDAMFPEGDADALEAILPFLRAIENRPAIPCETGFLDTRLPEPITIGSMRFGRGVPLRLLIEYAQRQAPKPLNVAQMNANRAELGLPPMSWPRC